MFIERSLPLSSLVGKYMGCRVFRLDRPKNKKFGGILNDSIYKGPVICSCSEH